MLGLFQLSFLFTLVFHFARTGLALDAENASLPEEVKSKCPVKWSWGPWSDCDPVTCTRFRRRRCELPVSCPKEVCMDKAFAKQRAVVRRYRPCKLRDTINTCNKRGFGNRPWGLKPFTSGSRLSGFQKASQLRHRLIPIYIEDPIMYPKKRMRRKGSKISVRTGGVFRGYDIEALLKNYPPTMASPTTTTTLENNENSSTTTAQSPFAAFFGQWSSWSPCELVDSSTGNYKPIIICAQMRTRVCSVASICGDYVLLHRRRCRSIQCHYNNVSATKTPPLITVSERPLTTTVTNEVKPSPTVFQHQIRQLDAAVVPSTMTTTPPPDPSSSQSSLFHANKQQCGVSELLSYSSKTPRIIGGRLVPRGKWPWMVVLVNRRGEQFCGGALIANQWVLTAAHCLDRVAAVRIGEHSLDKYDPGEISVRPAAIFPHPKYNPDDFDSDIGLILLDRALNYSKFIIPACLPPPERERTSTPPGTPEVGGGLRAGTMCTVVGWGKLAEHYPTGSARPREVRVPLVSKQACRKAYADQLTATQMCAGYLQGGRDSCGGDSGGPLMCQEQITVTERFVNVRGETQMTSRVVFRWVIEGLVSHGDGCGLQMKYGVYTRVDAFTDWVNTIVNRPEIYLGRRI